MKNVFSFKILFPLVSIFVLLIIIIRSVLVPLAHDEAGTFFFYIQQGSFMPFKAHVDANNHILNSFLAWLCYKLFGSSTLSIRIPNILGLVMLIIGAWRISKRLKKESSKLVLLSGFLLSFNWLGFFGTCRGYGISMGLFFLALSFAFDLLSSEKKYLYLIYCYILLQLAICANLILIVPALVITALICLSQLYFKAFFNWKNLLILVLHLLVSLFWLYFSFFLKDKGVLYLGAGNSYWTITFSTLITLLIGPESIVAEALVAFSFVLMVFTVSYLIYKGIRRSGLTYAVAGGVFSVIMLASLILGFFMMKVLLDVNYPEDRAGLFFYVLYMLSIVFIVELMDSKIAKYISLIVALIFSVHFAFSINFNKPTLYSYISYPERFYERILDAQKKSDKLLTIGGNRGREIIWAYYNTRHGGALNPMEYAKPMNLNADFCISDAAERKYYAAYYDEIDYDKACQFTLIKRKKSITRNLLMTAPDKEVEMNPEQEFTGYITIMDTIFTNRNPLEVSFDLTVTQAPKLLYAWMVLQIDSTESVKNQYKRIPLDWVRTHWAETPSKTYHLVLTTGKLPLKAHRVTFHTWNSRAQQFKFKVSNIKLYQLEGEGLQEAIPFPKT